MMEALFVSGSVADLVLAVMLLEAGWLLFRPERRVRARPLDVLLVLGPGACLTLALRGALTNADWRWIALALTASLPLHLLDLQRRRLGRR
jgi:hypothetical protein